MPADPPANNQDMEDIVSSMSPVLLLKQLTGAITSLDAAAHQHPAFETVAMLLRLIQAILVLEYKTVCDLALRRDPPFLRDGLRNNLDELDKELTKTLGCSGPITGTVAGPPPCLN